MLYICNTYTAMSNTYVLLKKERKKPAIPAFLEVRVTLADPEHPETNTQQIVT